MNSTEVIENITKIYDGFDIPAHLRMHMYRAASIVKLISAKADFDKNDELDIVAVMLIHDLGNIVKFKFDPSYKALFGKDAGHLDYWKGVQKEVIQRYGSVDYIVTNKMAKEIGVDEKITFLLENHRHIKEVESTNDFRLKLCLYSDARVSPYGVVSLEERFKDLVKRYGGEHEESMKRDYLSISRIEDQLGDGLGIKPESINDTTINPYLSEFLEDDEMIESIKT